MAGRPKGSRTKISAAGLLDLEPLAKDAIRAGLQADQPMNIRLEAAKIVAKYIYIEKHEIMGELTVDAIRWDRVGIGQVERILAGELVDQVITDEQRN